MFEKLKRKLRKSEPLTKYELKAMGIHVAEPNYVGKDELLEALKETEACQKLYKLTGDKSYSEKMFNLSIKIARLSGVPEDKILHNEEEGDAYFMG